MLVELGIRNFALIAELRLEAGAGFGVLTGETGAGKSIIVDALAAALGEKTGSEVVRTGAAKAVVEAVFDVSDCPSAASKATELGFEPEDGTLVLSREIAAEGRSQCRVNGRPTTGSTLREITSCLVDIHGQHEHQSLLSVPTHLGILDAWCGPGATELRAKARDSHARLSDLAAERAQLQADDRERARLLDLHSFQLDEINRAELKPGEEEELSQERNRLANAERLRALTEQVYDSLAGDGAAVDNLSAASMAVERLAETDPLAEPAVEQITSALLNAQEGLALIRGYRDEFEVNPERLEEVDERLDLIRTLKRKYGDTIEQVVSYAQDLTAKLDSIAHSEERIAELDAQIADLRESLRKTCDGLTELRRQSACEFEKAVERELAELAMEKSRFEASIEGVEPGPTGGDRVEFLISPNPGEPVKPLVKIASGGEMSRIMLALKTVMARAEVPTLVFDEIDAGIGGRTAQVLGEKLASLSRKCQVMCVTHLPQVASKAAWHAAVCKVVENGRTGVRICVLDGEERVEEIARMMGGDGSAVAADHAREMLSLADQRTG
jgi:DNA repair protein RecN (Recombination protein N)